MRLEGQTKNFNASNIEGIVNNSEETLTDNDNDAIWLGKNTYSNRTTGTKIGDSHSELTQSTPFKGYEDFLNGEEYENYEVKENDCFLEEMFNIDNVNDNVNDLVPNCLSFFDVENKY